MSDPVVPYNAQFDPLSNSQLPGWNYHNPWANAPGGPIGQQVASMAGSYLMGQNGFVATGMGYSGSLNNNMQQQMFSATHLQAMQQASARDMDIMLQTQRGMFAMMGQNVGAEEEKALRAFNAYAAKVGPYIDPRTYDVLTGGRGEGNLTRALHIGGQSRRDPVTGYWGMSADTSSHISQGLHQTYFDEPNYQQKTAGLTSWQMGQMFDELNRRGMMPSIGTERERVVAGLMAAQSNGKDVTAILNNAGVDSSRFAGGKESLLHGLGDDAISKLAKDSDVQSGMRSADAGRIAQVLDKYKGAVSAVQEIFGDAGHPNAPMRDLLNALDALTQGAMQQVDPGRTEMTVRNMYNAAKAAGVDMNTVAGMMQAAGMQTNAMGINPIFTSQMVTGGLVFGAAYNDSGIGSVPAWGMQNQKQMMGSYMGAYGRAINSDLANRVGALMRLDERFGGFTGDAAELIEQIKKGTMPANLAGMGYSDFVSMLTKNNPGISAYEVETAFNAEQANQEYIYKNNLGGLITRFAQPEELKNQVLLPSFSEQAYGKVTKLLGAGKHGGLADRMAKEMASSFMSMSDAIFTNAKSRNIRTATDLSKYLSETAAKDPNSEEAKLWSKLQTMTPEEREKELSLLAENAYTEAEQHWKELGGEGGLVSARKMYSKEASDSYGKISADVQLKSALDSIRKGTLAGGSPLMTVMQALQEAGQNPSEATLKGVIAKSLGGTGKEKLAGTLATDLWTLHKSYEELDDLQNSKLSGAAARGDKDAEARYQKLYDDKKKVIEETQQKIQKYMDDNGLTQTLGEMTSNGGGGDAAINFGTVIIQAGNAEITIKDAKGRGAPAKNETRGGSPVST